MTQEEKQLLLNDLCARLPYGVKILHNGWDSDSGTDFDTVETIIGIDDEFIYTVWDKTGDKHKHCLSISNWSLYLRPMSSMTKEEKKELWELLKKPGMTTDVKRLDWLNENMFDYRGLIPMGLALEAPKDMYD